MNRTIFVNHREYRIDTASLIVPSVANRFWNSTKHHSWERRKENMPMQIVHEFEAIDRTSRLSKTLAPYALVLVLMLIVGVVVSLDASLTPEQRIATFQQSGMFP